MKKYHKILGFPQNIREKAEKLIFALNNEKIRFSVHSLQELQSEGQAVNIGQAILKYNLAFNDVFEIVEGFKGQIEKIGFRIHFDGQNDIVFMLSNDKTLITAWVNKKTDNHKTLDVKQYANN
jgi:hypothetical protein